MNAINGLLPSRLYLFESECKIMLKVVQYFEPMDTRLIHIQGVAKMADFLATKLNFSENKHRLCVQAALHHDIGYAKEFVQTGFHQYDGYLACKQAGVNSTVSKVVLLHSGAVTEMLIRELGMDAVYFEAIESLTPMELELLEIVTFCDCHVSHTGEYVTISERVQDVKNRYPGATKIMQHIYANINNLRTLDTKYLDLLKMYI